MTGPGTHTQMTPFADDATAMTIGELTLENGQDRISLYGRLDLARDKAGLGQARALKSVLDAIVHALESDHALPDSLAAPPQEPAKRVKNPFATREEG